MNRKYKIVHIFLLEVPREQKTGLCYQTVFVDMGIFRHRLQKKEGWARGNCLGV